MKLKLSLTKNELETLIKISAFFIKNHDGLDSLFMHSFIVAFERFAFKQAQKFIGGTVKEKNNRITLSDMETLAFSQVCKALSAGNVSPYEMALSEKVSEAVAQQMNREVMLRMAVKNV